MKFYHSIRFRIVVGTLLFATLLLTLYTGILMYIMGKSMSRMIDNLIDTEVATFVYKYEKDHTTPLPHSKYINMYKGIKGVPGKFREAIKDLNPGVHSIRHRSDRPPIHVGMVELPDTTEPYYLIFHGREFFDDNSMAHPHDFLLISLIVLLIPGIIIGYFISKMLYAPVESLMEQIRRLDPDNIPARFSSNTSSNEIGILAQTIENTMHRIKDFIQREKQFTRDASHELRTPITIIKGAVEIMEQQPELDDNPLLKKPLSRISRSIKDMETTVETFLWLAREEDGPEEHCLVKPMVEKAIEDCRYLIEGKDIVLHVDGESDKSVNVKEEILYITVTNLIRNAFYFTVKGAVTIIIRNDFIEIQDTGPGIENETLHLVTQSHIKGSKSQGFGLGLSIVSRLCHRFGWKLTIDSSRGEGTRVKISW